MEATEGNLPSMPCHLLAANRQHRPLGVNSHLHSRYSKEDEVMKIFVNFHNFSAHLWWGHMDLNHEPSDYESDALTD